MNGFISVVLAAFERGIIFALLGLSVYTTSRVMRVDDLSLEGSFSLGAALGALCLTWEWNPLLVLFVAMVGGACVGLCTAAIHAGLGLSMLISGIVVTSGLFSVVLMMAGANISLIGVTTCFSWLECLGGINQLVMVALLASILLMCVYQLLHRSSFGLMMRATGANPLLVGALGRRAWLYKGIALVFSNALTGFVGALYVQYVGYFSIWMNVGILVVALTGLMIAELMPVRWALIHLVAGSVVYQLLLSVVYECDIDPQCSKLLTAGLVLAVAAIKNVSMNDVKSREGVS